MTRKWMLGGLIVSVALNLLVLGALAGAWMGRDAAGTRDPAAAGAGPRGGPSEIGALARGLDREARADLRRRLRAEPALREGRPRLRAVRQDVLAALRAQPFDPDALMRALGAQRAIQDALAERGIAAFAAVVADMSDAERADLADRFGRGRRHGGQGQDR